MAALPPVNSSLEAMNLAMHCITSTGPFADYSENDRVAELERLIPQIAKEHLNAYICFSQLRSYTENVKIYLSRNGKPQFSVVDKFIGPLMLHALNDNFKEANNWSKITELFLKHGASKSQIFITTIFKEDNWANIIYKDAFLMASKIDKGQQLFVEDEDTPPYWELRSPFQYQNLEESPTQAELEYLSRLKKPPKEKVDLSKVIQFAHAMFEVIVQQESEKHPSGLDYPTVNRISILRSDVIGLFSGKIKIGGQDMNAGNLEAKEPHTK